MLMLELLAPAGSMEALKAAVQNGADAVYLGCGTFNARQSAKNFTPQTLAEAVKYCHVRGVKVHLTLNTLVSDRETPEVVELIRHAATVGVDAFIVQDLSVVQLCRQIAPKVDVHGSTQLTVHSLSGVMLCAAMGMSRVVLSRELNRDEIRYICEHSPVEIEVFGHGALCMCYSGQCYMSSVIGGRSGNRGRCAQPCRQSYGYGRWENKYPLSLKDNCLVRYVRELEGMGVVSLKLEGRMKRAEYVATVTSVYRRAIDEGVVTRDMKKDLMTAFNREGFTDGYYTGNVDRDMFGIRREEKEDKQWLQGARQTYEGVENPLVDITFRAVVARTGSSLTITDEDGTSCTVAGAIPEAAINHPLEPAALAQRLSKTGGTPYRCTEVRTQVEPGLMLSAAAINAMRRDALNQLTALRARQEQPELGKMRRIPDVPGPKGMPGLSVQVTSKDQLTPRLLKLETVMLYVPIHILAADAELCQKLAKRGAVTAVLPRIAHDKEIRKLTEDMIRVREQGVKDVLVGNLGLLLPAREAGMRIRGDYGLNIYNSGSLNVLKKLDFASATLSFEMTMPQIRDASKLIPCEILIYGRLPLMVTEHCLIKNRNGECNCHLGSMKLTDKTGAEFPVIKDGNSCRSMLLNGKKLSWLDRQEDLARIGVWATRIYFTTENNQEVDRVLSDYVHPNPFDPGACTRGLYLRGLD